MIKEYKRFYVVESIDLKVAAIEAPPAKPTEKTEPEG
jgi:hypothetical protein